MAIYRSLFGQFLFNLMVSTMGSKKKNFVENDSDSINYSSINAISELQIFFVHNEEIAERREAEDKNKQN